LTSWEWPHDGVKERLFRGYRTQADALFPGGEIAVVPEVYFEPGAIRSA
jgi:hypothetical protein